MESDLDSLLFGDPKERRAYEEFCCAQRERVEEGFALGDPALVCRWRMAGGSVPALARHLRALRARRVLGARLPPALIAWVGQHIEWSLERGCAAVDDGVLMLVIDVQGAAAMSCGPYASLADTRSPALAARAAAAELEARATGVAPEVLCRARDGALEVAAPAATGAVRCGCLSLVEQLAAMRGVRVERVPGAEADALETAGEAVFLVSDEHGVVPAVAVGNPAAPGPDAALVSFLQKAYNTLLRAATRASRGSR